MTFDGGDPLLFQFVIRIENIIKRLKSICIQVISIFFPSGGHECISCRRLQQLILSAHGNE